MELLSVEKIVAYITLGVVLLVSHMLRPISMLLADIIAAVGMLVVDNKLNSKPFIEVEAV